MDGKVKVLALSGIEGGALGAQVAAAAVQSQPVRRITLDRTSNVGSERTRKAPAKRTDADWARWFAAQEKRQRKGQRLKTESQQRAMAEGRIVVVDKIEDIIA